MVAGAYESERARPDFIRKQVFFFQKSISGGNGSNDHAKLKSENGFEKQN
jgi:hypothetical protein